MTAGSATPPGRLPAGRTLALGIFIPFVAGAACVLGFAPFYAWPVPLVALALLFFAWQRSGSPRQAALSGFVFGLGYFLAGVSWIYVSLHEFGSMPAPLAALATFLFCAFLALFPAAAGWLAARLAPQGTARRVSAGAAAMTLLEWVRGWIFTGFPWINLGSSQVPDGPLAGIAPWLGVYGLTLAVCAAAALALLSLGAATATRHRAWTAGALVVLVVVATAGGRVEWTRPAGEPIAMGLLQGNVPQQIKWQEEVRTRTLLDYRSMIFETPARIVVVPETALPAFFDQLPPDYVESLRAHARERGKEILLGTVEREFAGSEFRYYNSLVRLGGETAGSYRKRHLVPFGEFIPPGFRWVLAILKIPMSDFTRGPANQAPLVAAGIPFAVAICYEDLFGAEMIDQLPAARVLVNVSNDAWFGESFAADQHLQASQVRALESGRWMVRSTNTGASAVIDERGRVVKRLPAFVAGTLVHPVPPREGATPYVRVGDIPALALALLVLVLAARSRRSHPL